MVRRCVGVAATVLMAAACGLGGSSATPAPSAATSLGATPTPYAHAVDEWPNYMGDPARSGIGPGSPVAANARRTWTAQVDGDVYGAPLVAQGSVIAATEHDTVYALDAVTGAVRWQTHLGEPVPASALECGNIDPNGITSTPVIDTATGLVLTVAMLNAPIRHELFALRLADGTVAWHRSADAPGADPGHHQQRGALNLAQGHVYFTYGGFTGDCGSYHGRVVRAATDGSGPLEAWQVPSHNLGGIWAPPGAVISPAGDVWVSTGNTETLDPDPRGWDYANAVIRIDAGLQAASDQWAPSNWASLNRDDVDLGSLSPALLPGGLIFMAGKEGIGYLLPQRHLDGIGKQLFKAVVCPNGNATGGAFGGAAVAGEMVYVPCKRGDGLVALRVNARAPSFTVAWRTPMTAANSPVLAYGLVWTVAADPAGYRAMWSGALVGLDPMGGTERFRVPLGSLPHFPTPAAAAGRLYVAGLGVVYGVSVN